LRSNRESGAFLTGQNKSSKNSLRIPLKMSFASRACPVLDTGNPEPIEIDGLPLPDQGEDKLRMEGVTDWELLEVPLIKI
jgi:hypothetical protein